jgi:pimeloyl-ACP methyl ester carboxylesterase
VTTARLLRRATVAVLLGALVACLAAARSAGGFPGRVARTNVGSFARRVALSDGRKLYLECRGQGSPTVILEAGLRNGANIWSEKEQPSQTQPTVFPAVGRFTRVCAYDRPGTTLGIDRFSRSDPVRMPRTARDAVLDLHGLTMAARIPPPYVLVGHSTGGLLVRMYTRMYPREIRGMVLVDAFPETVETSLSIQQWNEYNAKYLTAPPPALASYADLETFDFIQSFRQMLTAPKPPRQIPLIVLSKVKPYGIPAPLGPPVERAWNDGQRYLAALEPGTPHVIATNSGHYIQVERPKLVIDAIRRVVAAVRSGRSTAR